MFLRLMLVAIFTILPYKVLSDVYHHDTLRIIQWLTDNSKYEWSGEELPEIKFEDTEVMCEILFVEPPIPCDIGGYYNDDTNQIFIANEPTRHMVEEGYVESVLVHELVHYLQFINGEYKVVECNRELERDAFDLQDKYVTEFGLPEEHLNDPLFALMVSSCHMMHTSDTFPAGGG